MKICLYLFFTLLLAKFTDGQDATEKPIIEIKQFEYIYEKDHNAAADNSPRRIILLLDDSVRKMLKSSFTKALKEKWGMNIPDLQLTVKQLPMMASIPKFKTKLKDKDPAKLYLFLQIFDKSTYSRLQHEMSLSATWEVKYQLISGKDDSIVADRFFTVEFFRAPAPPGQLQIVRYPAYPSHYFAAFDSIASLTFNANSNKEKIVLRSATIYQDNLQPPNHLRELTFSGNYNMVQHLTPPSFVLKSRPVQYVKTNTKKNVAGNSVAGALTLFTGIGSDKRKSFNYTADYSFLDGSRIYHCLIGYTEVEVAERTRVKNDDGSHSMERGDFTFAGRYVDTSFRNIIILDNDTLGWFNMQYYHNEAGYTRMWDGYDSSTIRDLPFAWENRTKEAEVMLTGVVNGLPFSMSTVNVTAVKEFTINGLLAAVVKGYVKPATASLYQPLTESQLKLVSVLSSLPYEFLNRHTDDF